MPQITVTADRGEGTVTWRERINASDFESKHFANHLVERIGWAVDDAHEVERDADRRPLTTESASSPAPASVPAADPDLATDAEADAAPAPDPAPRAPVAG